MPDSHASAVEAAFKKVPTLSPRFLRLLEHADKSVAEISTLLGLTSASVSVAFAGLYKRLGLSELPNRSKRGVLLLVRARLERCPVYHTEPAKEETIAPVPKSTGRSSSVRSTRPLAVSDHEVAIGARRVSLIPGDAREVLALMAEGRSNTEIRRLLGRPYSRVASSTAAIYQILDLRRISDRDDKRRAAAAMYRRSLAAEVPDGEIEREITAASEDRQRFEELEELLNRMIDAAEAALKLIGRHRKT